MAGTELSDKSTPGAGEAPGPGATFVEILAQRAEHDAGVEAFAFLDYTGEQVDSLTFAQLEARAREIAVGLQQLTQPGDRAVLSYTPGLECVAAMYGCVYAGLIAVPCPASDPGREHAGPRIRLVAGDCDARVVLTSAETRQGLVEVLAESGADAPRLVVTDGADFDTSGEWRRPDAKPQDIALLQYTSGSTGAPRGVMVSHENLIHNCDLIARVFEYKEGTRGLMWLPPYHDMGLIGGVLAPVHSAVPIALMSPITFLLSPITWLRAISRYRATACGGPDFAFDMCVRRTRPEDRQGLDLSSWELAYNGAEVVRRETIDAFTDAFAVHGFRREAFYPCFGLAEATLMVTGGDPATPPTTRYADPKALEQGRFVAAEPASGAGALVGCGGAIPGSEVLIVDPETLERLDDGEVGEIWVAGTGVARGYWNRSEETRLTFEARLASGDGPYLRTGDLGFLLEGELYVNGRLKDVLVVDDRVHYPTDVERVAEQGSPALRHNCGVAFTFESDGGNRLGLVYEANDREEGYDEVFEGVRAALSERLGLELGAIALIEPRTIPRTTSGKLKRVPCRAQYLNGDLEPKAEWRR